MKNKGFTLVELLAVIAILAILVIVAMPNVLGMFNQAKVNSFVTEVQKIMDTATTTFTRDALLNSGKTVYYSSESNAVLATKPLDMSGNKKNYFIEMDRNGNFKRVVVYDSNYCYDIYSSGTNGKMDSSKSKLIVDKIEKTTVVVSDVWESGSDSVGVTINGINYVVSGCEGVVTVEGKDTNLLLSKIKIEGTDYNFVPYMTWGEWINSSYNTLGLVIDGNYIYNRFETGYGKKMLAYTYLICFGCTSYSYDYFDDNDYATSVMVNEQLIKNAEYDLNDLYQEDGWPVATGKFVFIGQKYYDFSDNGGIELYNLELKTIE